MKKKKPNEFAGSTSGEDGADCLIYVTDNKEYDTAV